MGTRPRFNPAIQGLDVFVDVEGRLVRAIIPRVVFELELHSGSGPVAWAQSYRANAAVIDEIIRKRFAARAPDFVVVRSGDIAGKCN